MSTTTIVTGVLLIVLGLAGYIGTGSQAQTALIPAWFGIPIAILGFLANDPKRRALTMHIAVTIGLLGFLGAAVQCVKGLLGEAISVRPVAVVSQGIMALITGVFVALCVRSFIQARAARTDKMAAR